MRFVKESLIRASADTVVAFHEAPDAFGLLRPPWQESEVVQPPRSLEVGTQVILRAKFGPVWRTIEAEHVAYEPCKMWDCKTSKMSQSLRAALNAFGLFAAGAHPRARPHMVAEGGGRQLKSPLLIALVPPVPCLDHAHSSPVTSRSDTSDSDG